MCASQYSVPQRAPRAGANATVIQISPINLRRFSGNKGSSETRPRVFSKPIPINGPDTSDMREVRRVRAAIVNEVRFDDMVWSRTVARKCRRMMLFGPVLLIVDV